MEKEPDGIEAKIREYIEHQKTLGRIDLPASQKLGPQNRLRELRKELGEEVIARIEAGEYDGKPEDDPGCDVAVFWASPVGEVKLDLEKEMELIEEEMEDGQVPLKAKWVEAKVDDLGKWILRNVPRHLHFSGHGTRDGKLVFQNSETREAQKVEPEKFVKLLKIRNWKLDGVFLNCCWSLEMAEAFAEVSDWVVGMKAPIGDKTAVALARKYYRGLAIEGNGPKEAFEWAMAEYEMAGGGTDVPKLIPGKTRVEPEPE